MSKQEGKSMLNEDGTDFAPDVIEPMLQFRRELAQFVYDCGQRTGVQPVMAALVLEEMGAALLRHIKQGAQERAAGNADG